MFDNLLNKRVKLVWHDGQNNKASKGVLYSTNEIMINLFSDDQKNIFVSIKDIVSIIELLDGE